MSIAEITEERIPVDIGPSLYSSFIDRPSLRSWLNGPLIRIDDVKGITQINAKPPAGFVINTNVNEEAIALRLFV